MSFPQIKGHSCSGKTSLNHVAIVGTGTEYLMKLQYSGYQGCFHHTLIQAKWFFNVKYTSELD